MAKVIDREQIPKIQLDILSHTLLTTIEQFYSDPVNRKRFNEWLHSEEGLAYTARQNT